MQIHWRLAKNAVANLGRGSAAAMVALLLPPVLVRHMTPASYAVWVLVLQTAAYVGYFNFGLQTAIGRYVAYANEKQDVEQRDSVFSTAFAGLCCAALVSLVCLAAATLAAPAIFPSVPTSLIPQMRLALLLVGVSMAVELPASACNGVFIGMQRNEIPALTAGGARLFSALGVIAVALATSLPMSTSSHPWSGAPPPVTSPDIASGSPSCRSRCCWSLASISCWWATLSSPWSRPTRSLPA
jgi:O-antigen/teichoic acid export membrane protein